MKQWPNLTSDQDAEAFVAEADLTEYDLSELVPVRFELKDKAITLRLPVPLLDAIHAAAKRVGIEEEQFIRRALEEAARST